MTYQAFDPDQEINADVMLDGAQQFPALKSDLPRSTPIVRLGQGDFTREFRGDGRRLKEMRIRRDARVLGDLTTPRLDCADGTTRRWINGWLIFALFMVFVSGFYMGYVVAHLWSALR